MTNLIQSNALNMPLKSGSAQMCVTSPPYFAQRAYNTGDQKHAELGSEARADCAGWATGNNCGACYVCHMRQVFAEVWRVLRDDGTLWLNLGEKMTDKQLLGIPWRVALALQADGWYLRSEIIWHKPAPMPESTKDRPTKAHEQIFLLSKRRGIFTTRKRRKRLHGIGARATGQTESITATEQDCNPIPVLIMGTAR